MRIYVYVPAFWLDGPLHSQTTSWWRHNFANEGPHGKSTLTPDIASRCKRRQLQPEGDDSWLCVDGQGDNSWIPNTMQGRPLPINCCLLGWDDSTIGDAVVLPTEARRSNQPWPPTSPKGARVQLRSRETTPDYLPCCRGTWFPIGRCHAQSDNYVIAALEYSYSWSSYIRRVRCANAFKWLNVQLRRHHWLHAIGKHRLGSPSLGN